MNAADRRETDGASPEATVHALLRSAHATVAVAESLTGGLLAARLTAEPGASTTFRGGVVAYAGEVKVGSLGVSSELLRSCGTVDPAVATAMGVGVRDRLDATYGLGLTGVAGPGPTEGKQAGTVHIALACPGEVTSTVSPILRGNRDEIRRDAVVRALEMLRDHLLGQE